MRVLRAVSFAVLACALAVPSPLLAQDDAVEITSEKLAPGVWVLFGRGGNIGLSIGDDGVLMVDDQFAPLTEAIRAEIDRLGGRGKDVRFVVNTHFHPDHVGGNEMWKEAGALIVAHDDTRLRMTTETLNEAWERIRQPAPEDAWPTVTFSADVTFHFNGEEIHVHHVGPAHTDGDAIVHFRNANVIHTGDVVFSEAYPFFDTGVGGHLDGVIAATDRILELANDETKLIVGHGHVATREEVQEIRDMLATIADRIRAMLDEGKSEAEILVAKPTAEWDAEWGGGWITPEKLVEMTVRGMTMGDDE